MASAMVGAAANSVVASGTDMIMEFQVAFCGMDVRNGFDQSIVTITITASDTLQNIRSKLSSAVTNEATRLGYAVATTAMVLPQFQRG